VVKGPDPSHSLDVFLNYCSRRNCAPDRQNLAPFLRYLDKVSEFSTHPFERSRRLLSRLHESAHSVVRQLLIGDLGEMGFMKRGAYSYPVECKLFKEMSRSKLEKIAVVVAAGIVAEESLCSAVGNKSLKEVAISDDEKQLGAIQRVCGFSDEEMQAFHDEARVLVEAHETAIRKVATEMNRRNKLSGEKVRQLMEKHGRTGRPLKVRSTSTRPYARTMKSSVD
jgi:hypothetical protein